MCGAFLFFVNEKCFCGHFSKVLLTIFILNHKSVDQCLNIIIMLLLLLFKIVTIIFSLMSSIQINFDFLSSTRRYRSLLTPQLFSQSFSYFMT